MFTALLARLMLRRPPLVRVNDRTGVLRKYDITELGGWACVDFGNARRDQHPRHRDLWFPADQVTLVEQDT